MLWIRSQSKFAVGLSDRMRIPFASIRLWALHPHSPWEEQQAGGFSKGMTAARQNLALLQGCPDEGQENQGLHT